MNERGLQQPNQNLDAVELSLYVCKRLQGDNDWLVDKLAQVEQQRIADEKLFRSTMEDGQPPHQTQSRQSQVYQQCDNLELKLDMLKRDTVGPQECEDYKRVLNDFRLMQEDLYDCITSIEQDEFSFNEQNPKHQDAQLKVSNRL